MTHIHCKYTANTEFEINRILRANVIAKSTLPTFEHQFQQL